MSDVILDQLREAIINLEDEKAGEIARKGIEEGLEPLDIINQGIRVALDIIGERFTASKIFLPELMLAAKAADEAVEVLEPELLKRGGARDKLGNILLSTVKGDIHDIGKNIVALLMKSAGFNVLDLGVDREGVDILSEAEKNEVDIIGLSALLTTTMPRLQEFMDLLQESGVREKYKVMVGGAPVSKEFAEKIGADGYGADASRAVEIAKRLMK